VAIMELKQHFVTTKDGRKLEFATIGNESGKTVVFHHGTPGAIYTFMEYQELVDLGTSSLSPIQELATVFLSGTRAGTLRQL